MPAPPLRTTCNAQCSPPACRGSIFDLQCDQHASAWAHGHHAVRVEIGAARSGGVLFAVSQGPVFRAPRQAAAHLVRNVASALDDRSTSRPAWSP